MTEKQSPAKLGCYLSGVDVTLAGPEGFEETASAPYGCGRHRSMSLRLPHRSVDVTSDKCRLPHRGVEVTCDGHSVCCG